MNRQQSMCQQFNVESSENELTEEICMNDAELNKCSLDTIMQKYHLQRVQFTKNGKLKLRKPARYHLQPLKVAQQNINGKREYGLEKLRETMLKRDDGCRLMKLHKSFLKSPRFLHRTHNNQ